MHSLNGGIDHGESGVCTSGRMNYTNRVLGPLLFVSFVVSNVFILLNIFLALINSNFAAVKEKDKGKPKLSLLLLLWRVRSPLALSPLLRVLCLLSVQAPVHSHSRRCLYGSSFLS